MCIQHCWWVAQQENGKRICPKLHVSQVTSILCYILYNCALIDAWPGTHLTADTGPGGKWLVPVTRPIHTLCSLVVINWFVAYYFFKFSFLILAACHFKRKHDKLSCGCHNKAVCWNVETLYMYFNGTFCKKITCLTNNYQISLSLTKRWKIKNYKYLLFIDQYIMSYNYSHGHFTYLSHRTC